MTGTGRRGYLHGMRATLHQRNWFPWRWLPLALLLILAFPATAAEDDAAAKIDLARAFSALVAVEAEIPAEARTARALGRKRTGYGVVIDDNGLILTIGYLILEASGVQVIDGAGNWMPARVLAYHGASGFGLLRAEGNLEAAPMRLGDAAALGEAEPVLALGHGGPGAAQGVFVVSRRTFAGYWEYLLERAIFTAPPYRDWAGAALVDTKGRLVGIGSLLVPDARPGPERIAGNMFVPIDLLKPILADLITEGRESGPAAPWLGMFTAESMGRILVTRVSPEGPARGAGVQPGDVVIGVAGRPVADMADMLRRIWSLGPAGTEIPLLVNRGGEPVELVVPSADRRAYLKLKQSY